MKGGLFTRQEISTAAKGKVKPKPQVAQEAILAMGSKAAEGMNPKAVTVNMQPAGPSKCSVYVLGMSPGESSDSRGRHFSGESGSLIRSSIPSDVRNTVVYDYCVRTRVRSGRKYSRPSDEEIAAFRTDVEGSIASHKPSIIIGLGPDVLAWAYGKQVPGAILAFNGKLFPMSIAGHEVWFMPIIDPAWIVRLGDDRMHKVGSREWKRIWKINIKAGISKALKKGNLPSPVSAEEASSGTVQHLKAASIIKALKDFQSLPAVGIDIETHNLRPYLKDSKILTCAVSDGTVTHTFPIDHPGHRWSDEDWMSVTGALEELLRSGVLIVAHNMAFELEWLLDYYDESLATDMNMACSQQAAYTIDPGPPGDKSTAGLSLDSQCIQHFGLPLKSLSPAAGHVSRLQEVKLSKVLEYNALDAKWCLRLFNKLMKVIEKEGLEESYARQIARLSTIVLAQRKGICVSEEVTREFHSTLASGLEDELDLIQEDEDVKSFCKEYGEFNPMSNQGIGALITWAGLANRVSRTGGGSVSTDAHNLELIEGELPVLSRILDIRGMTKIKGTYVDRFLPEAKDTFVFPDGRIHSIFRTSKTRTTRLSSEDPNGHNWPKRKFKEVRRQLVAEPGHVLLSVDQAQIEARGLAMESKDPQWSRMIWEGYDIHAEYATKLLKIKPSLIDRFGTFKGVRAAVKNSWVFPAFYKSSIDSIIRNIGLPDGPARDLFDEFWETFAGIADWQDDKLAEYARTGAVRSLTGRIRRGPLSENMVVNTGVQTLGSDISQDAGDRLSVLARERDMPWLQTILLVHDDLTFSIPTSKFDEALEIIVGEELGFKAPWLNVPLEVEAERGPNLFDMKTIGAWSSAEL